MQKMKVACVVGVLISHVVVSCHALFYPYGRYMSPHHSHHHNHNDDDGAVDITGLIANGQSALARQLTYVDLPGLPELRSHSGFATTDAAAQNHLFWWYFPSRTKNVSAPLIIWLQGGPGGASTFGLFAENGPIQVDADMKVSLREESWNVDYQMLFIDSPVGAGFSYTTNDGYCKDTRNCVADNLYEMLVQFYEVFPEVKKQDLYITGESYGGKYVPAFAHRILFDEHKADADIPLKGIAVGDGWTDPVNMIPGYPDLLFNTGLIGYQQKALVEQYCNKAVDQINAGDFFGAFETWDRMLNGDVFPYPNLFHNMTGLNDYDNYYNTNAPPELTYYGAYLAQPHIKTALHVGSRTQQGGHECEMHLLSDFHVSLADELVDLLESGIDVLYYSGALDIIIATSLTERFLQLLEWSGAEEYRKSERMVWRVSPHDDDVAGWARKAKNFHFVTVHDAGHLVPFDQPRAARNMIDHLIKNIPYENQPDRV